MKFNKEPMFLKPQAHPRFLYVTVTVDLLFTIVGKSCFIRYVRYVWYVYTATNERHIFKNDIWSRYDNTSMWLSCECCIKRATGKFCGMGIQQERLFNR